MLMLICQIKSHWYALEATHVVEVIPRVPLRQVPNTPPYIAGLLNYRGTIVPIIDLSILIENETPSQPYLSTRIIMIRYQVAGHQAWQSLGLIAEQVTETLNPSAKDIKPLNLETQGSDYLGGMILNDRGMVQCIDLDKLFVFLRSDPLLTVLTPPPSLAPSP